MAYLGYPSLKDSNPAGGSGVRQESGGVFDESRNPCGVVGREAEGRIRDGAKGIEIADGCTTCGFASIRVHSRLHPEFIFIGGAGSARGRSVERPMRESRAAH